MRLVLPLLLVLAFGCTAKPISEVPSIGKRQGPDTTDRDRPSGKTLAAALSLLDPRQGDFDTLGARRHAFETQVLALVPDEKDRAALGFQSVLQWHELYARRKQALDRTIAELRRSTEEVLSPGGGAETRIDDRGQARICLDGPDGKPACRRVAGLRQFGHEFEGLDPAIGDVLEAQWFVITTLDALRMRLDPTAPLMPIETASTRPN